MSRQTETGYLYLDESGAVYRPTWKGAVLMTWKLIWPISTILKAQNKSRNQKLISELQI